MEYQVFCTSTFAKKFEILTSITKHYSSLGSDIFNLLHNKNLSEVFELQEFIHNRPPFYRVIKCRLPNSQKVISEREGFRLYFNVLMRDKCVNFLFVYPKTGPKGMNNVDANFMKFQTELFAKEKTMGILKEVIFDNEHKTIKIITTNR